MGGNASTAPCELGHQGSAGFTYHYPPGECNIQASFADFAKRFATPAIRRVMA